ncbi:unnamed protein product [Eruca vesicaria subsp. sativa]|uniref:Uncharacterized protein n=1 Tax=Eruca vesicaria subsp. sativa TaxID=29727 RepID=A0ABC8L2K3_ERUVS|nr:unnamed protein product [Eruca vesicaria subsp. sativa]
MKYYNDINEHSECPSRQNTYVDHWKLESDNALESTTYNYQNTLDFGSSISRGSQNLKDDGKGDLFDIQDEERKDEIEVFRTWRAKVEEIES